MDQNAEVVAAVYLCSVIKSSGMVMKKEMRSIVVKTPSTCGKIIPGYVSISFVFETI